MMSLKILGFLLFLILLVTKSKAKYVEGHIKTLEVKIFIFYPCAVHQKLYIDMILWTLPLFFKFKIRTGFLCRDFAFYRRVDATTISLSMSKSMENFSYFSIMMSPHNGTRFIKRMKK